MSDVDYSKGGRLAEALAKAQGEIRNPGKNAENPHFRSRFTNLAAGIAAIRGPLSRHGIAYVQTTRVDGPILILTTKLVHAVSGETEEAEWPIGAYEKLTPQQLGSSTTYARRYTLFTLVGIAPADEDEGPGDEDDDGSAATTGMASDLYIQKTMAWITNASDATTIRDRWAKEAIVRRDLLSPEQSQQLLDFVTKRTHVIEGKPQ